METIKDLILQIKKDISDFIGEISRWIVALFAILLILFIIAYILH